MTIANETNRSGPYSYNGATTEFAYEFKISNETHIRVVEAVTATGVETDLVLNTDYTVTGVGADGGNVVISPARASGKTVTLVLDVPFTQLVELENQGAYFAKVVEGALDLAAQRDKQLSERVDRAVVVPVTSDIDPDALIEDLEAGSAAAVASAAAAAVSQTAAAGSATAASGSATAAAASQTAAAASQTAAAGSASAAATSETNAASSASAASTSADNASTSATAAAGSATAAGADAVATAADRVQTGLDRVQTGLDRVQTGIDAAAAAASAASLNLGLTGYINGLLVTNNLTDFSNDIDVAAGSAADGSNASIITLTSTLTKRLDAAWAVGTGNGGLDTGAVGNNTYYVWLIKRVDTGGVDVVLSLSKTAPTMPANYTLKRLISSFARVSAANNQPRSFSVEVTDWVAWTPTFTGFGVVTGANMQSRRSGDTLEIEGTFICGTPTATTAFFSLGFNGLNGGLTIDSNKVNSTQLAGVALAGGAAASSFYALMTAGQGVVYFGIQNASRSGRDAVTGSALAAAGAVITLQAKIPIAGW